MKKRLIAGALALMLLVCGLSGCSEQLPAVYVQSVS